MEYQTYILRRGQCVDDVALVRWSSGAVRSLNQGMRSTGGVRGTGSSDCESVSEIFCRKEAIFFLGND